MRRDWAIEKLGDFAVHEKGKKPKNQKNKQDEKYKYAYINIEAFEKGIFKSFTDGEKCNFCSEDDFLMVWDGSRSGLVGKGVSGALGSTLVRINFPGILNDFAYFFLKSKYLEINTRAKGTGTPHVDPGLLWNYEFPIAPISEQRAIIIKIEELFSSLDHGIAELKIVQEKLKIYRQSVLKKAFKGLDLVSFEEIVTSSQNGMAKRKGSEGSEIKVLRLADITNLKIDNSSPRSILLTDKELDKYQLNEGDLLIIRVNGSIDLVGRFIHVTRKDEVNKWAFCDHLIRIILDKEKSDSRFYYYFFQLPEVRKFIHQNMVSSAGQNTVSQGTVKAIPVPTISLENQHQIVQEIESRLSVCDKVEQSIKESLEKSEALRQSILKKAFEGNLLSDLEIEKCKQEKDYESADVLLYRIKSEKIVKEKSDKKIKTKRKN